MKGVFYILALMCLCCITVSAQTSAGEPDYVELYRNELARKDSLEQVFKALKNRDKELKSKVDDDDRALTKMKNTLNDKQKELADKRKKLIDSELPRLIARRDQLADSISMLRNDSVALAGNMVAINGEIERISATITELENFKNDFVKQLIADNKAYTELPFSQMTHDSLLSISNKCKPYVGDASVASFVKDVDNFIKCKLIFDRATTAVNSRYDKNNIAGLTNELQGMGGVNKSQKAEIDKLLSQLKNFEPGLRAFQDFIAELDKRRAGFDGYGKSDYEMDYPYIIEKKDIQARIDTYIKVVPYLNRMFTTYAENPMEHSDIEKEIIGEK